MSSIITKTYRCWSHTVQIQSGSSNREQLRHTLRAQTLHINRLCSNILKSELHSRQWLSSSSTMPTTSSRSTAGAWEWLPLVVTNIKSSSAILMLLLLWWWWWCGSIFSLPFLIGIVSVVVLVLSALVDFSCCWSSFKLNIFWFSFVALQDKKIWEN